MGTSGMPDSGVARPFLMVEHTFFQQALHNYRLDICWHAGSYVLLL